MVAFKWGLGGGPAGGRTSVEMTILEPADCNRNWLIAIFDSLRFISVEICIKYQNVYSYTHTLARSQAHFSNYTHVWGWFPNLQERFHRILWYVTVGGADRKSVCFLYVFFFLSLDCVSKSMLALSLTLYRYWWHRKRVREQKSIVIHIS